MDKLKDVSPGPHEGLGRQGDVAPVSDRVGGLTDKLDDIAGGGPIGKAVAKGGEAAAKGDPPSVAPSRAPSPGVKDKITGGGGKGGKGATRPPRPSNIIETIDVGVPIRVAYNQWTSSTRSRAS